MSRFVLVLQLVLEEREGRRARVSLYQFREYAVAVLAKTLWGSGHPIAE